jgi:hypothetical protein
MRFEDVKNEHNLLRIEGINPEDFLQEHVGDSFCAGEKHFHEEHSEEADHEHGEYEEKESDIDFVKYLIFPSDSSFLVAWRIILLSACMTSPYYYAWVAHEGYETTPIPIMFFECLFAFDISF